MGVLERDRVDALRRALRRVRPEGGAPVRVRKAITVRCSAEEAYGLWRDYTNLPRFMVHLESVEATGDRTSRWRAKGPLGVSVDWEAELVDDRPGELIAWRSLPGADVPNAGSVRFTAAPGDRGTEVHVELEYEPPGGNASATVAKLFGEEPATQLADDLRRFKQVLEVGEVVRSDGAPAGHAFHRHLRRPAQPLPPHEVAP